MLVEEEEEERLTGVDGEVPFEMAMSGDFDVLEAIIPTRLKSGVVGGVLAVKSMVSFDRRIDRSVSSNRMSLTYGVLF